MADDEQQAKAATAISAAARGRKERTAIRQQHESAVKIEAAMKGRRERKDLTDKRAAATKVQAMSRGRLTRKQRRAKREAEGGDANPSPPAVPGQNDAAEGNAEAQAAEKIGAAARGRRGRKAVQARREAAEKINKVAKGRKARKEFNDQRRAATHISAHFKGKQARTGSSAHPAAPTQEPLPLTFSRPPVMYKFLGLDESKARRSPRFYSQTYSINVEGYHSVQQTKLIVSIEVQGPLHNLTSIEPVNSSLTPDDWSEIARALVTARLDKMTIADFGPLFLLSQVVFGRVLPKD